MTVDTFNWLRINFFWPKEVGGGLATGSFVTVANFTLHLFGEILAGKYLKIFLYRYVMTRASKLRRLLFSLEISQENALLIFAVKRSTVSGIN